MSPVRLPWRTLKFHLLLVIGDCFRLRDRVMCLLFLSVLESHLILISEMGILSTSLFLGFICVCGLPACLCACTHMNVTTDDSLLELVLSFHHVGPVIEFKLSGWTQTPLTTVLSYMSLFTHSTSSSISLLTLDIINLLILAIYYVFTSTLLVQFIWFIFSFDCNWMVSLCLFIIFVSYCV